MTYSQTETRKAVEQELIKIKTSASNPTFRVPDFFNNSSNDLIKSAPHGMRGSILDYFKKPQNSSNIVIEKINQHKPGEKQNHDGCWKVI